MEIKDILREKSLAETLAERDQMILNLYMENEGLKKVIEAREKESLEVDKEEE